MKTLILSSPEDVHAGAVLHHLKKMNAQVDFFRYEEFIEHCSLLFSLGTADHSCNLRRADGELDLLSYTSIWHRRPGEFTPGTFIEPWISKMVEQEARSTFFGMLYAIDCIWVNFPANDTTCISKLMQLQLANKVGLNIPETVVTNRAEVVEKFFEQCNGQVIYKLVSEHSSFSMPQNERPSGIPTLQLRAEDLPFIDQVNHAPHLFQRCIRKECDLRVTVVGKEIFCIRIESQSGEGKIDWRNDYTVEMEPYDLPEEIKSKCLELMRRLKLNYGAIDLILSKDGQYVFLEINCAGQYLWIEERTNLPISESLAKLLTGNSEPLVPQSHLCQVF